MTMKCSYYKDSPLECLIQCWQMWGHCIYYGYLVSLKVSRFGLVVIVFFYLRTFWQLFFHILTSHDFEVTSFMKCLTFNMSKLSPLVSAFTYWNIWLRSSTLSIFFKNFSLVLLKKKLEEKSQKRVNSKTSQSLIINTFLVEKAAKLELLLWLENIYFELQNASHKDIEKLDNLNFAIRGASLAFFQIKIDI